MRILVATAPRTRVYLEVCLETKTPPAPQQTTEHQPITEVLEFTYGWEVQEPRGSRGWEGTSYTRPWPEWLALEDMTFQEGWTPGRVRQVDTYGARWHLNGMKAGCAHQSVVWEDSKYGRRPDLERTAPCPETGYRYGSAWLSEPLPAEVLAWALALTEEASRV